MTFKLHLLLFKAQQQSIRGNALTDDSFRLLERLAHGMTPQALRGEGRRVELKVPTLHPGVDALGEPSGVVLNGLLLIENQVRGSTLLYLPGAPNGRVFSEHRSLQTACQALADMALDARMERYLAETPVDGQPTVHASYIRQALSQSSRNFIGATEAWPVSESLAQYLLQAERHRFETWHDASSRTNRELYWQEDTQRVYQALNLTKMAAGYVPIFGSFIAAYDFWGGANAAVRAFLEGRASEGVDELFGAVMSLVDVLVDAAPAVGAVAGAGKVGRLAKVARSRQTLITVDKTTVTKLQPDPIASAGRVRSFAHDPFMGAESTVSLAGMEVSRQLHYKGTYLVGDQYFISHRGKTFEVLWDASIPSWRLAKGSRQWIRYRGGKWKPHANSSRRLVNSNLSGGGLFDSVWDYFGGNQRGVSHVVDGAPGGRQGATVSSMPTGSKLTKTQLTEKVRSIQEGVDSSFNALKDFDGRFKRLNTAEEVGFKDAVHAFIEKLKSKLAEAVELGGADKGATWLLCITIWLSMPEVSKN